MADRLETDLIVEAISKGFANVNRDLDKLNKESEKVGKGMDSASKAGEKQQSVLGKLKDNWQGIAIGMGAAYGAIQTVKRGWDFAKEGAQIQKVANTFDSLTASIGTTSQALLVDMRKATAGMVADTELMASANQLISMGLAETADQASELTKVAVTLGSAMGKDATASMEEFSLLLANQSIPRLDTFGISAGKVRTRIKELQAADRSLSRETAFMTAVMEEAAVSMDRLGGEVPVDTFSQFEVAIKNTTDALKVQAAEGLGPIVGQLSDVAQAEQRVRDLQERGLITDKQVRDATRGKLILTNQYVDALIELAEKTERQAEVQAHNTDVTRYGNEVTDKAIDNTRALVDTTVEYQRTLMRANTDILQYAGAVDEATESLSELRLAQYELAQSTLTQWIEDNRDAIDAMKREILGLPPVLDEVRGRAAFEIYADASQAKQEIDDYNKELDGLEDFHKTTIEIEVETAKTEADKLNESLDKVDDFYEGRVGLTQAEETQSTIDALNDSLDIFNTANGADTWYATMDTNAIDVKENQIDITQAAADKFVDDSPYEALFLSDTEQADRDIAQLKSLVDDAAGTYNIHFNITTSGAPPMQHGGPVAGGRPYIVGEAGPELFVPSQAGHIVPNNQISNHNNNQTVNIYTGADAGSILRALEQAGIRANALARTYS